MGSKGKRKQMNNLDRSQTLMRGTPTNPEAEERQIAGNLAELNLSEVGSSPLGAVQNADTGTRGKPNGPVRQISQEAQLKTSDGPSGSDKRNQQKNHDAALLLTKKENEALLEEIPDDVIESDFSLCHKNPGTTAKKIIKAASNHFALNLGGMKEAHQYDVKIERNYGTSANTSQNIRIAKTKDKEKFKVMKAFLERHFPNRFPAFDSNAIMFASKPLLDDLSQTIKDMDVVVDDEYGKPKSFTIEIQWVKLLDLTPKVATAQTPAFIPRDVHQCIEVVFKNVPLASFTQVGRDYYHKPEGQSINLGGGLEVYHGFTQSVVIGGRWEKIKPMLNLLLVHKGFYKAQPVLEAFVEIINDNDKRSRCNVRDLKNIKSGQSKVLNDYIRNIKVSYQVPGFPGVTYRVKELGGTPQEEKLSTGITILEYFRNEKRYNIQYPDIPLLKVGSQNSNIMIPPELCVIEQYQPAVRKLEDFQMRNMIAVASTDTKFFRQNVMNMFRKANFSDSPYLREFGFSVCDKFEAFDARVLPPPTNAYRNGEVEVEKGVWRNKRFWNSKTITKWAVVSLDKYVDKSKLDRLVQELDRASKSCGTIFEASPDYLTLFTRSRFGPTLSDFETFFKEQKQKAYDIIFVVLPGIDTEEAYANVKRAAEIEAGCLTQCLQAKTLNKLNTTTVMNIMLKLNGKLNGTNHIFSPQTKPIVLRGKEPFILLGADVTHPGPFTDIPCSIAAIIASHDPTGFHYKMSFRLQPPRMEVIEDFKNVAKEQLKFFYKQNKGAKPEKIIYFRDGVADGQYNIIRNSELMAITRACKELQPEGYDPKIAVIIIQKRHHARLFPIDDKDSEDRNFNLPAGTCVDTNIVNPGLQSFYLFSHASIKGTSRPTKYTTIHDDLDLSNDQMQELAYYLCHMFARCNRSVSYPAPTYYAHLAALRAEEYVLASIKNNNQIQLEELQEEMSKLRSQCSIFDENPMFFI